MSVVAFPSRHVDPDWLTAERMAAYYIALSVNPEIAHAAPVVRAQFVDRVIAGLRAAQGPDDALANKGRLQCLGLMRHDYDAAQREGWLW